MMAGDDPGLASGNWVRTIAAVVCVLAFTGAARAQDLEPKAYSASPVGAAFLVVGFARSTGAIVFDPALPVTDVDGRFNAFLVATGYTFDLFGKMGLITATLPYAWGEASGQVAEQAQTITRAGLADARVKFSVNLVGNPAMGARAFARAPRKVILGTSLTVATPIGQYDPTKLINLGTNRWAFKPELGVSVPKGPWDFDGYVAVWLYAQNAEAFPGDLTRSQDPLLAVQVHASYTFRPRLWIALDLTRYDGGAVTVGDGAPTSGMGNSRVGATLSLPMGRQQSLKVAYSSGVAVRTGTDFKTVSVAWQWLRLTKL